MNTKRNNLIDADAITEHLNIYLSQRQEWNDQAPTPVSFLDIEEGLTAEDRLEKKGRAFTAIVR